MCAPDARALAAALPHALHERTVLVCPLSGAVLTEDNPPLVLPSGRVAGTAALRAMAAADGGTVTCPATGRRFAWGDLRRVFFL